MQIVRQLEVRLMVDLWTKDFRLFGAQVDTCVRKGQMDELQNLMHGLSDLVNPSQQCFLCGKDLEYDAATLEHVIPRWAQARYELWDQQMILLNGTSIPYRQLRVPCCADCNKYRLKPIEDAISTTVEKDRNAVIGLSPKVIFLWLGKIFYGILYRELMLLHDQSNPAAGSIISQDFINRYKMHRFFLQQARELVELKDFTPGSVFVFNAEPLPEKYMEWDLQDNVDTLFICVRVGHVAIFGVLADGGAQQLEEEIYSEFYSLRLHPIQIREICARISYRSSCATRTPKFIIANDIPHQVWQMPLSGLSAKPLFEEFDSASYAAYLAHYTRSPIDKIYEAPDKVMTWLRDNNNHLRAMSFVDFPFFSGTPN